VNAMGITRRRIFLALLVLAVALLIGYFFEGRSHRVDPTAVGAATPAPTPATDVSGADGGATSSGTRPAIGAENPSDTSSDVVRTDELPEDAQAVARDCLIIDGRQTLPNPQQDAQTLTAMVSGFFQGDEIESHVFEHEITFVDSDGVTKRLYAHRSDELQPFRVRMYKKAEGQRDQPEDLPYELRDLPWEDIRTRYLNGKEQVHERTLSGMHAENDDKVGLIETIDGRQVEVNLQVGGKSLGCSYDPFSKKNRCDCSDVPVE
jgi:hypothetical protein